MRAGPLGTPHPAQFPGTRWNQGHTCPPGRWENSPRTPPPGRGRCRGTASGIKSDRVRPVHRFNFPRLTTVVVTALVVFVSCAQGPGTSEPRGSEVPSMGTGPSDTAPVFAVTVANRTYTEGEAISPLMLPEASSGNGTLSYSLTPTVPGLTFNSATRTLSGTPTAAGTYGMTYQAVDGDANTAVSDAATVTFTITVQPAATPVGCSADAETWRGLRVCSERPRDGYDRDAFGTGYSRLEDDIIAALPPTMKAERTGLYALLVHCIRYHVERDRCDRYRAHRCAGGGPRQRNRQRSATGHRQRPGQSHDCGSDGEPLAARCAGRNRMEADPPRSMVRAAGDRGKAGVRIERRPG